MPSSFEAELSYKQSYSEKGGNLEHIYSTVCHLVLTASPEGYMQNHKDRTLIQEIIFRKKNARLEHIYKYLLQLICINFFFILLAVTVCHLVLTECPEK